MTPEPPPFQEANRCDVCKCSFNAFRRRHHCRCCGRTLCNEHSSDQMPLPQFGIHTNVRVCSDCFNNFSKSTDGSVGPTTQSNHSISEAISTLDLNEDSGHTTSSSALQPPVSNISECKCGMPLCICVVSLPPAPAAPVQTVYTSSATLSSTTKKTDGISRQRRSAQDSRQGSSVSVGPSASGSEKPQANYEVNGEGLREAIKSGDLAGVKDLLKKGVDSNYCDKQGLSLLHLAAVFNQTEIVFCLMDHGARLDCKNSLGETPLDCAPATLQYKMKKKIEGEGLA
ncbi:vacuolar protein sorting-associated protein 27-like [Chenopodium quinoa]|uniref:FYVE-type domain-containing protein n=1 Tax=Chenopodium quinoa TaxID=63459 RepID=A0A803M8U8_CHEQI|nr:vacuolar protein sorting-associated protein 27-like [Chenopodium quinoa]